MITYEENPNGVTNSFHHKLIILKIVVTNIKNLVGVNVGHKEHDHEEADDNEHPF